MRRRGGHGDKARRNGERDKVTVTKHGLPSFPVSNDWVNSVELPSQHIPRSPAINAVYTEDFSGASYFRTAEFGRRRASFWS